MKEEILISPLSHDETVTAQGATVPFMGLVGKNASNRRDIRDAFFDQCGIGTRQEGEAVLARVLGFAPQVETDHEGGQSVWGFSTGDNRHHVIYCSNSGLLLQMDEATPEKEVFPLVTTLTDLLAAANGNEPQAEETPDGPEIVQEEADSCCPLEEPHPTGFHAEDGNLAR